MSRALFYLFPPLFVQTLDEQTSILFSKLDAAAALISTRHSNVVSKHSDLGDDMASTFQNLSQSCKETTDIVEIWSESDNAASRSLDITAAVMGVAKEKVRCSLFDFSLNKIVFLTIMTP